MDNEPELHTISGGRVENKISDYAARQAIIDEAKATLAGFNLPLESTCRTLVEALEQAQRRIKILTDFAQAIFTKDDSYPPTTEPDQMLKIDGKTFRCKCGCNVFRSPQGMPNIYVCNACEQDYEGE